MEPDFSGYATRNDLKCSDGRVIKSGAFKHHDQQKVPLVWQHQYDEVSNVLGYALLQHREDGVYAQGYFNDNEPGQMAKKMVQHGDITALSIFANNLTEKNKQVSHGNIREVSLVLSGANPGALIDYVNLQHADGSDVEDGEAIIYMDLGLEHSDDPDDQGDTMTDTIEHAEDDGKTVKEVFDSLNEEQKNVVYFMIGEALSGESDDSDSSLQQSDTDSETLSHSQEDTTMTRNVFEQNGATGAQKPTLSHDQLSTILGAAEKTGSLKEAFLQHGGDFLEHAGTFGINDIDVLFPDHKAITNTPEFIKRRTEWVDGVLNGVRKSPFTRIKSLSADITHEEARARGYIKGNLKKEEFFGLKSRKTGPTTVYKKQKLDRDDILDITDLDVVAWLKQEMRLMLDEELAGAILVGDGRDVASEDKIKNPRSSVDGDGIRAISTDDPFYAPVLEVDKTDPDFTPDTIVEQVVRARALYEGSGNPVFYTSSDTIIDLLLIKDTLGRRLYATEQELASAMRVSRFVELPQAILDRDPGLVGVIVNLADYTLGADKGGNIAMFEDFDIDYNQNKYLIETRVSGTLTKHRSAIVLREPAVVTP